MRARDHRTDAPRLLERDDEIAFLVDRLTAFGERRDGGCVLIEGPPGIGKTALLQAALEAAPLGDLQLFRARGNELEASLAFGGVRQLLAPAVLALDATEREALLVGPAGLARPVLGLAAGEETPAKLGDPLFGLFWLAVELSERGPLVLAVDDLHWLDDESGRFAAYLADRLEGVAILLVATARPDEPGAAQGPVATLAEHGTVIRPRALTETAVGALLEDVDAAAAYRTTGGNPLFVKELGRAMAATPGAALEELGPASVAKLVLGRVDRISAEAGALARAVALFADGAALEDAAALARLDDEAAERAADGLIAAQVLTDGTRLAFAHPVMRRALYDELGPFARRRGHGRAAARLKERGAASDEIAAHLLAGEPAGNLEDMRLLRAAAAEAEDRRALHAAARYLERALAEEVGEARERADMRARLGRLLGMLGEPEAEDVLRQAAAETEDPGARADLVVDMARVAHTQGNDERAVRELERFRAGTELDPQRALAVDSMLAGCAEFVDVRVMRAALARIPRDLPGDTEAERLALSNLAYAAYIDNEPAAVVRDLVLRSVGETGEIEVDVGTDLGDSTNLLRYTGDLDTAEALARERIDRARETGAQAAFAYGQLMLGDVAVGRGDFLGAEAEFRLGLDLPRVPPAEVRSLEARLSDVMVAQGRLDEADRLIERLAAARAPYFTRFRGAAAAARGDVDATIVDLSRTDTDYRSQGLMAAAARARWVGTYADALATAGRGDEALGVLTEFLAAAERFDEPGVLAVAHRDLGRHLRGAEGLAHLERAHALLDPSPYRYEAARARLELGARLRRENERAAARELMLPALEYAERQHLAPLGARLREELRLVGSRPRTAVRTGVDALTPSEERIARLAADGMTNKQIAQHLFLTVKTVEMHLAGSFRKLDIRSRRDLPAVLEAAG